MKFDFTTREVTPKNVCTRGADCPAPNHRNGCIKLAADLARLKADRARYYGERP